MATEKSIIFLFRAKTEPKLEIDSRIEIKEGLFGIVLATFLPKTKKDQIGYVVRPLYKEETIKSTKATRKVITT